MSDAEQNKGGLPDRVKFHYIKSLQFRVIHVDGVIGGPMPSGQGIHMALFSERPAIPQQVEQAVEPDGKLGAEIEGSRIGKDGIAREMEIDAMMNLRTAKLLYSWLAMQIAILDKVQEKGGGA
jgi:hypothetical protein